MILSKLDEPVSEQGLIVEVFRALNLVLFLIFDIARMAISVDS